jgi:hypothetical protein
LTILRASSPPHLSCHPVLDYRTSRQFLSVHTAETPPRGAPARCPSAFLKSDAGERADETRIVISFLPRTRCQVSRHGPMSSAVRNKCFILGRVTSDTSQSDLPCVLDEEKTAAGARQ